MVSQANFFCFQAKISNGCNFFIFWPILLNLHPRSKALQRCMARQSAAKKSGSSHLLGVVPSQADQTAFVSEFSKAVTFLSYVVSW